MSKKIAESSLELIGNTPMLKISRYAAKAEVPEDGAVLYAKMECFNPAGSAKDRVALSMVEDAEAKGILKPGATIIEPTSGNTGIGLAAVAVAKGYKAILTLPDTMSVERRNLLKAYGAKLELSEGAKGMSGAIALAEQLRDSIDGAVILGQFDNLANPAAHRATTGPEIWEQMDASNEAVKEPGPRMEYVELILDNDYKGLYCLVEPVDEKKLELDDNDVLYKVLDHWPFTEEDIQKAISNQWKIASPVRIRYPEYIADYEAAWYPMRDYTNKVYYSQDGFQRIGEMIYPENAYDMYMFLMVVSGSDNFFKNMYFTADVKADGSYTMRQIPWDLDLTFGNVYAYESPNFTRFDSNVTYEYSDEIEKDINEEPQKKEEKQ